MEATGGAADDAHRQQGQVDRLNETIPETVLKPTADGRLEWVDRDAAHALFYQDCDAETVAWAFERFSPAPPNILVDPIHLPNFWSAGLPRSYIICLRDRALPFATAMRFAGRLGVVPHFIEGSHSPFLSRPAELAATLVAATKTNPVADPRPF